MIKVVWFLCFIVFLGLTIFGYLGDGLSSNPLSRFDKLALVGVIGFAFASLFGIVLVGLEYFMGVI